jgi:hypothetical protein
MKKEYEMITVKKYIEDLDDVKVVSLEEREIERQVEKYLISSRRAETNAKTVEALIA